ncbi:hypothetical protein RPC_2212 [Rhodopseudomonas palustris BisB18]|uniref:Uncharacterized protein n=1 Tax=Rhodopseudomonas palustris (strain BisB18) TaxID=316056 RepID=Q216C0_RHOPB
MKHNDLGRLCEGLVKIGDFVADSSSPHERGDMRGLRQSRMSLRSSGLRLLFCLGACQRYLGVVGKIDDIDRVAAGRGLV